MRVEVAQGDSLARIARLYGTTVEALVSYNAIEDPSRIDVGTWLLVPVGGSGGAGDGEEG
jgi:LysM repeat protein